MANKYVDARGGSDSNAGTSWADAWKTLDKVGSSYATNCTYYFKTGIYSLTAPALHNPIYAHVQNNFIGCGYVVFTSANPSNPAPITFVSNGDSGPGTAIVAFYNIHFNNFGSLRNNPFAATVNMQFLFYNCIFTGKVGSAFGARGAPSFWFCSSTVGTKIPASTGRKYIHIPFTADSSTVKSANYDVVHPPSAAFLNNSATAYWLSTSMFNVRANVDLGTAKIVKRICIADAASPTGRPSNITVLGSNIVDSFNETNFAIDAGWVALITAPIYGVSPPISAQYMLKGMALLIPNTVAYRYYSIKINALSAGTLVNASSISLQEEVTSDTYALEIEPCDDPAIISDTMVPGATTACAIEGANIAGLNGAVNTVANRAGFIGASMPVPFEFCSATTFEAAEPWYIANPGNAGVPYFPALSKKWLNDATNTSGTANITNYSISIGSGQVARAISPVFNFGGRTTFVGNCYRVNEYSGIYGSSEMNVGSGTTKIIEYRISDTSFLPTESGLQWIAQDRDSEVAVLGQYVQYRLTLRVY